MGIKIKGHIKKGHVCFLEFQYYARITLLLGLHLHSKFHQMKFLLHVAGFSSVQALEYNAHYVIQK